MNELVAATTAPTAGTRPPDWLLRQLPVGLLGEDFFVRFVSLFQAEAETLLAHADNLPHLADPQVTPRAMVRHMASWIGLPELDASEDLARHRELLLLGAQALPWRGTRRGLLAMIEALTGQRATVRDGGGVFATGELPPDPAWVEIDVNGTGSLDAAAFMSLVRDEIPAHVRCTVRVGGEQIHPPRTGTA